MLRKRKLFNFFSPSPNSLNNEMKKKISSHCRMKKKKFDSNGEITKKKEVKFISNKKKDINELYLQDKIVA